MSGEFLNPADLWAWVYELTKVKPGDFGSLNDNDDAAIRARNNTWTHQWSPCWSPSHEGCEL